jgi:hypothetical protein
VNLDDYTADAICQTLGLGRLDPGPVSAGWALRLVFKPSFHPEVVVTLNAPDATGCAAEVAVPAVQVWQAGLIPQIVSRATADLGAAFAADFLERLSSAPIVRGRWMTIDGMIFQAGSIDGMSFDAVLRTPEGARAIADKISEVGEESRWVRDLLVTLHARIEDAGCAGALAAAGSYAGLELVSPEPGPPATRIGIFGSDEEREALVRAISAAQDRRGKPGT